MCPRRKKGPIVKNSSDGYISRMLSLQLHKKSGNSPDISKGISQSGMSKFESSRVSQPVQMPANGGLLRFSSRSPGSEFGHFGNEIADSLRRIFETFPFLGDGERRPGSFPHCVTDAAVQLVVY